MTATRWMVLMLALAGCSPASTEVDADPSKITYSRDTRTGLCFAALGRASVSSSGTVQQSMSITAVPCSPAVLALIPQQQRSGV